MTPEDRSMRDRQDGDYAVTVLSEPDDPEAPVPVKAESQP